MRPPERTVQELLAEAESGSGEFSAPLVAQLPKFLRTFYLRFLDEELDLQVERFSVEEGHRISDRLVDLEAVDEKPAAWSLLYDFVDLCDYFSDFGLLSVPEAAIEHEVEIFELSARVFADFADWATNGGHEETASRSRELSGGLESLGSLARSG